MQAPFVRTGYESVFPVRANDKFCISAEKDGEVIAVTNKSVKVQYGTDTKEYKIKTWTSKEEANSCYTHTLIPNVKVGDKLKKDDTILYNSFFFEPDIFNPKRVIYKQGTYANVAIMEDPETFEDSGAISKKMSKRLGTQVTKVRSIILYETDNIHNLVNIGDKVEPGDPLFSFSSGEATDDGGLSEDVLAILEDIKTNTPKSKVKGTISNIVVYYNTEKENLSPTLKAIVEESDKRLIQSKDYPGRVNSSYSIRGKPLGQREVEIKIYTIIDEGMSVGDKAIFGNQLKFTVGSVFEEITTEDNEEVDALFGFISIQNRIVNSPNLIGTTSTLLKVLQDKAVDLYFNK